MRLGLILLLVSAPLVSAEVTAATPSQDEIFVLQHVNALRTGYKYEKKHILAAYREKRIAQSQNFEHFWDIAALKRDADAGALVYSPALMTAAKALLTAGQTAPEKKVFDAKTCTLQAGYNGAEKATIALFAKDAPDLLAAFATSVINVLGEDASRPDYIIPYYSLSVMCKSTWRDFGIAISGTKGRYNLVLILGEGGTTRPIGGVVYADVNNNRQFDVGEGRVGVPVSAGTAKTISGPGGAWRLDSEPNSACIVTIGSEGQSLVRTVAPEALTAQIDWRLPSQAETKQIDMLIADAVKAQALPDEEKRIGPLAALLVGSRMLDLDTARADKITPLVEPVAERFTSLRAQILKALAEDPKDALKEIETQRKRWNGALPNWFKEATKLVPLRQQILAALAAQPGQGVKLVRPLLGQLEKTMEATTDQAFMELYLNWHADLEVLLPAEPSAEPGKKKK